MIQLVGHLRRPEAAHVAIEQIALDRLAQAGGAAGAIGFPSGRKDQRATRWECAAARAAAAARLLQRDHILRGSRRLVSCVTCSTRAALRFTGVRCFMTLSPDLVIELPQEAGVPLRHLAVDLQAGVRPAANPLAVVQVRRVGRSVARVRLVIAAAGADRPRPAGLAIGLVRRCDASAGTPAASPTTTPSCTLPKSVMPPTRRSDDRARRCRRSIRPCRPRPAPHGYALAWP